MRSKTIMNRNIKRIWAVAALAVVIIGAAAGYFIWNQQQTAQAQSSETTLYTSKVKQGSITLSVSGSGTLTAGKERSLAFSTSGTVANVNVQVGDVVKQGQELAALVPSEELQVNLTSAQQDWVSAQQDLQTLKENAAANLANAQLALASAQKAVIDAKSDLIQPGMVRCDQDTIDVYYYAYKTAKEKLDALGAGVGDMDYYNRVIVPAKNAAASAYSTYEYCFGYTDYEISSSQATLSLEEANLTLAQEKLDILTQNQGLDPVELAAAENKVAVAQLAFDQAQEKLAGMTLTAPFDGTILSVAGNPGDSADTNAFITIADLAHPLVDFSIDETDMDKISVDETAEVTFDALPDLTFTGKVLRINPELQTSGGYNVVTGVIQLDLSGMQNPPTLRKGLSASVTLIQASAEDVLLVPVQAVRDLGNGKYGVFVVGNDGTTSLKFVEIGLMDAASAEVKSGLSLGESVSTGDVQTK